MAVGTHESEGAINTVESDAPVLEPLVGEVAVLHLYLRADKLFRYFRILCVGGHHDSIHWITVDVVSRDTNSSSEQAYDEACKIGKCLLVFRTDLETSAAKGCSETFDNGLQFCISSVLHNGTHLSSKVVVADDEEIITLNQFLVIHCKGNNLSKFAHLRDELRPRAFDYHRSCLLFCNLAFADHATNDMAALNVAENSHVEIVNGDLSIVCIVSHDNDSFLGRCPIKINK